ncbi:MAG: IS200/IS605 family transposase [Anaerolineales bacterium]|nr:IS200/IS605 family transposase [Anaerolineales bacterium]
MPYYRLFYHMVWGTKNREPFIQAEFENSLHNVIAAKGEKLGALIYAVGGVEDHVHLVATVPPQVTLSDFIGQVKGHSSHFVNQKLAIPYHFQWQREYGVVSFGGKQLDQVVKYVKNQHQHHAEGTLIPFLEHTKPEQ